MHITGVIADRILGAGPQGDGAAAATAGVTVLGNGAAQGSAGNTGNAGAGMGFHPSGDGFTGRGELVSGIIGGSGGAMVRSCYVCKV